MFSWRDQLSILICLAALCTPGFVQTASAESLVPSHSGPEDDLENIHAYAGPYGEVLEASLAADQVDTAILHVEQEMLAKSKVPDLHAIGRMWELQPKTLYTFLSATEKTIKDRTAMIQAVVTANIEATRIMYTEKAKVMPIFVKQTGYPEKILSDTYDFMVKECIWDANSGLSAERVNFTAELMAKIGNIKEGKTPTYDDIVDASFAKKAIEQLGEWKGPVCPTAVF